MGHSIRISEDFNAWLWWQVAHRISIRLILTGLVLLGPFIALRELFPELETVIPPLLLFLLYLALVRKGVVDLLEDVVWNKWAGSLIRGEVLTETRWKVLEASHWNFAYNDTLGLGRELEGVVHEKMGAGRYADVAVLKRELAEKHSLASQVFFSYHQHLLRYNANFHLSWLADQEWRDDIKQMSPYQYLGIKKRERDLKEDQVALEKIRQDTQLQEQRGE